MHAAQPEKMTLKIKKNAIFLLFSAIFAGSTVQTTGSLFSYAATNILILIAYLFLSNNHSIKKYQVVFTLFVGLYFYTIFNSLYIARSSIIAIGMFASFLFFCVLNDSNNKTNNAKINNSDLESSINQNLCYLTIAKYALAFIVLLNALTLILTYIDNPIRATGQFRDYSQSAFSILLAFGLIQPKIKNKTIFTPITLVFFLGFFTTFSRTANFLLIIYLIGLFIIESRNKNFYHFLKTIALIAISYAIVQTYPLIIEQETISRGISDIVTLNSRTFYWQAAWEAIQRSPFWGYGLNTFEYTGIQALVQFQLITNIHNDYIQVWHDLGAVWLMVFVAAIVTASVKFAPVEISRSTRFYIRITDTSNRKQVAWLLMMCVFSYMAINFILLSQFFQAVFALLIAELLSNEQT